MARRKEEPKRTWMDVKEAAAFCGVSVQYLYQSRCKGTGPKCTQRTITGAGKGPSLRLTYQRNDLVSWNAKRLAAKRNRGASKTKKAA